MMINIYEYLLGKKTKMSKDTTGFPKIQNADDALEIVDFLKAQEFEEIPVDKNSTFNDMPNILLMNAIKKKGNFDKNYFMRDFSRTTCWIMFCSGKWAESPIVTDHHLYKIYFVEDDNEMLFKIDSDEVELDKFKEEVDNYFYW